ncbi:7551_t:CDS:2 [Paraglomus occultum]|uniref:7551_t:CDS:1 n=1 Tax=Paraglomus occultum TaxID=144539 RepID=A0A9N9GU56_9GLOM|nr:7551_t:CDS:2 [Paraglomus occultum]
MKTQEFVLTYLQGLHSWAPPDCYSLMRTLSGRDSLFISVSLFSLPLDQNGLSLSIVAVVVFMTELFKGKVSGHCSFIMVGNNDQTRQPNARAHPLNYYLHVTSCGAQALFNVVKIRSIRRTPPTKSGVQLELQDGVPSSEHSLDPGSLPTSVGMSLLRPCAMNRPKLSLAKPKAGGLGRFVILTGKVGFLGLSLIFVDRAIFLLAEAKEVTKCDLLTSSHQQADLFLGEFCKWNG